ncbi:MAG: ribonuclease H-like domain-containing protein [Anaerolineae bacterium]|nr:ribonuclease H-like domain-containing protein [Thermoflexales bacterium]MDW8406339.1 ribonuclease H-like domain-containing protein [Anaerolineae bacterium]
MDHSLRERLKRLGKLGVQKGVAHLKPAMHSVGATQADPTPLWNVELSTPLGPAYIRRTKYPLHYQHGAHKLDQVLSTAPTAFREIGEFDARDALFLDTETTGLAGGAGTLAFLVGVGYFDVDREAAAEPLAVCPTDLSTPTSFVIDQFFLPNPAAEAGMLCALDRLIEQRKILVTFNGRGFDAPLLQTRFALARIPPALSNKTHLDLLLPSRRLWRYALPSRSLGSLENHILSVRRDQQDIPGALIPELYRAYLQTGQTADIERVMYHNLFDVLSMVTLAAQLAQALTEPATAAERLSIAVGCERAGQLQRAEAAYRTVLCADPTPAQCQAAWRGLARCLKRQNRAAEALRYWEQLAEQGDVEALIEMAKHYEWRAGDLSAALSACRRALHVCQQPVVRAALLYRASRLENKLSRIDAGYS